MALVVFSPDIVTPDDFTIRYRVERQRDKAASSRARYTHPANKLSRHILSDERVKFDKFREDFEQRRQAKGHIAAIYHMVSGNELR